MVSSWTEVGDLNTGRRFDMGCALTSSNALGTGGYNGSAYIANNESWDGTSWTEVGDLNTARGYAGGVGTNTDAIIFGGFDPGGSTDVVETLGWNFLDRNN